jgi:hypothetical protein
MSLETKTKRINEILEHLKKGEWQIPQFQRDFVWSPDQVKNLISSFIKSYPIGLVTIWDQPQNKPHTPGEPLKLKEGTEYKHFTQNPAIIKLVLDGKQRLTTLAMVFGGLHSRSDRFSYSGGWFIDIDAMQTNDESKIVKYKKQSEINSDQLNTLTICVQKGLIPLKDFDRLGTYLASIHKPEIYPEGAFPSTHIREKREYITNRLLDNYKQFLIPIAEIPSSVDLGAVCEIFDVLNTTGTNVSTFDLIHNLLFKYSGGKFLLKDQFKSLSDLKWFGNLCDDKRQEYFNQVVTGCYLSEKDPFRNSNSSLRIESIKGKDLIDTPLQFYETIIQSSEKLNSYTEELFEHVLKGQFRLSEIPYPVQIILYLSLRWYLSLNQMDDDQTKRELNKIFRAFFWRNTLSTRYDQGFLTQFAKDLEKLKSILIDNQSNRDNEWARKINSQLDELFGPDNKIRETSALIEIIKREDAKGALEQGLTLLINSKSTKDIVTNEPLDRFTDDKANKVQLHHIFPKQWCKDNEANNPVIHLHGVDHFANLMPLTAKSNNEWKTLSPSTAIKKFDLNFVLNSQVFENYYINQFCFAFLQKDNINEFWNRRAEEIADELYKSQFVS